MHIFAERERRREQGQRREGRGEGGREGGRERDSPGLSGRLGRMAQLYIHIPTHAHLHKQAHASSTAPVTSSTLRRLCSTVSLPFPVPLPHKHEIRGTKEHRFPLDAGSNMHTARSCVSDLSAETRGRGRRSRLASPAAGGG